MGRKYKNPPVIEAVCEFRFEPSSPWDLAVPGLIYDKLRGTFSKRQQAKAFEAKIATGPQGVQQQLMQIDRLQFLREDGKALIQVSPDFLAVNHLRPYPTWEGFLPLIQKALGVYREVADPKGFHRIGLRYINKIDFPGGPIKLEQYFEFYPFVGQQLPQDLSAFIVGIQIPFEEERDILKLLMNSSASDKPDVVSIVLDLDYFLGRSGDVTFANAFQWLEQAHTRIESTFEGCLKETLREKFEEIRE